MKKFWQFALVLVLSVALMGCVVAPYGYPQTSHRTATITNPETGEVSVVDTTEETGVPAPWSSVGAPEDWNCGVNGWTYLGVPYNYYGAPYFVWGLGDLYAASYVYQSAYWYGPRWHGYSGQGHAWNGWNNRWHGGGKYHGPKYGHGGRYPGQGSHKGAYKGGHGQRGHGSGSFQGRRGQRPSGPTMRQNAPVRQSTPAIRGGGNAGRHSMPRSAPTRSAPAKSGTGRK